MKKVYSTYHRLYGQVTIEDWQDLKKGLTNSIPVTFNNGISQAVPKGYLIECK